MKVLVLNGSPRKLPWNTATLLEKAADGAREEGAEVDFINLYELNYKGCQSCFACKIKNAQTHGVCAIQDELRPVLELADKADVVIMGSPIYWSYLTGMLRSFMERFLFPHGTYSKDPSKCVHRDIKIGLIYTMGVNEELAGTMHYPDIFNHSNEDVLKRIFGYAETLWCYDTYQFTDYDKYDADMFDVAHKTEVHQNQFPEDCRKAFEMGQRLVRMAKNK